MFKIKGIFDAPSERVRVSVPNPVARDTGVRAPRVVHKIGMDHLLPSSADRSHAARVLTLIRGRYPEPMRATIKCEVLCVERETYTLRVRGVNKVGSLALEPVLRNCPGTLKSYEADAGLPNRASQGIDLHIVILRHVSTRAGGGGPADPRKRQLSSDDDDDDDLGSGRGGLRSAKRRPNAPDVALCMSIPPMRIVLERPVVLPRDVLQSVERDDRPSVSDITDAVCNADASMPRIELTVIPRDMDYILVYAGARLMSWPLVRYICSKFPAVANVELTVRRPVAFAQKLLGEDTPADEVDDLAAVWKDTCGTDGHMSALFVMLVRASTFAATTSK